MLYATMREIYSETARKNTFEIVRVFTAETPTEAEGELRMQMDEFRNKSGDKWHLFTLLLTVPVVKK